MTRTSTIHAARRVAVSTLFWAVVTIALAAGARFIWANGLMPLGSVVLVYRTSPPPGPAV